MLYPIFAHLILFIKATYSQDQNIIFSILDNFVMSSLRIAYIFAM
jgi:hypothetical protein